MADLELQDGCLANVMLSGDFFLEPDSTLAEMNAAIEGAPEQASEDELAQRVRAAAGDAELLGITPEGVAIAVRRAVSGAAQ